MDLDSPLRGRRRGYDGGAVVSTQRQRDRLAVRIEREDLCGCGHEWSDHVSDGNGYRVCWRCPSPFTLRPFEWWACVIDRGGYYGIAPSAYVGSLASEWLTDHESPDAYRWSPE